MGSKTAEKNSAQTDTTKLMVTWPWTKTRTKYQQHKNVNH